MHAPAYPQPYTLPRRAAVARRELAAELAAARTSYLHAVASGKLRAGKPLTRAEIIQLLTQGTPCASTK